MVQKVESDMFWFAFTQRRSAMNANIITLKENDKLFSNFFISEKFFSVVKL